MHATGHMKSLKLSCRQQQVDEDEEEEEEEDEKRERKARQRELNDVLSGRPIWSKKEGPEKPTRAESQARMARWEVRCCRVHCRTVAVWTASSVTNCSGLCGQKVVCAYLLPPTLLSAAIPSAIWHLASAACDSAQR